MLKRSSDRELFAPLISQVKAPGRTGSLFLCLHPGSFVVFICARWREAASGRFGIARLRCKDTRGMTPQYRKENNHVSGNRLRSRFSASRRFFCREKEWHARYICACSYCHPACSRRCSQADGGFSSCFNGNEAQLHHCHVLPGHHSGEAEDRPGSDCRAACRSFVPNPHA